MNDGPEAAATPSLTLSVVVPCRDSARWLPTTLQSVQNQIVQANELIIVDDGSTDDSKDIAQKAGVDAVIESGGVGAAAARNAGAAIATGDWLVFLDADDVWYPDRLMRTRHAIERSKDGALLYHFDHVAADGNEVRQRPLPNAPFLPEHAHALVTDLKAIDFLRWYRRSYIFPGMSAFAVRRDIWTALGGMDATQTRRHDFEFFLRYLAAGHSWMYDPVASSAYRSGQTGNLSANLPDRERFHQIAVERHVEAFDDPEAAQLMREIALHVARARLGVAVTHGTAAQRRDAATALQRRAKGLERWLLPAATRVAPGVFRALLLAKRRMR